MIADKYKYTKSGVKKRLSDQDIVQGIFVKTDIEIKSFKGKEGDILCLDTYRCFHFGSRKAINSRLLVLIEYGSIIDYTFPKL